MSTHHDLDRLIWLALEDLATQLEATGRIPCPGAEPVWEPDAQGHLHLTLMTMPADTPTINVEVDIDLTHVTDRSTP